MSVTSSNLSAQLESAKQLASLWEALVESHIPPPKQFLRWLNTFDVSVVEQGIHRLSVWITKPEQTRRTLAEDEYVRYASGAMAGIKRDLMRTAVRNV